jgi:hypothetical protein
VTIATSAPMILIDLEVEHAEALGIPVSQSVGGSVRYFPAWDRPVGCRDKTAILLRKSNQTANYRGGGQLRFRRHLRAHLSASRQCYGGLKHEDSDATQGDSQKLC